MLKRLLVGFVVAIVFAVCAGLIWFNFFRAQMIAGFFDSMQAPVVTISAVVVEPTQWTPTIEAIGTLNAAKGIDVAAQAAGVITQVNFGANDEVAEGQLLVQINDAVERADLAAAQAAIERDRAALKRAQTLSKRGISSEASLEEAQTTLAASESTLARLQATIDLKAIEAPFSGTIGIPQVEAGQYVQAGQSIATLQQLDTMRIDFTVPEQRLADLQIGQPASFGLTADAFPYTGRITGIDPRIDPQTRLISVRAEIVNPDGELRPGQFARVRVELPTVTGVVALPQTSVVTSLYGDYVYVIEAASAAGGDPAEATQADSAAGGAQPAAPGEPRLVASQTFVTVGRRQGDQVEILDGVEAGQSIATSGQNKLNNGSPVRIDNSIDPANLALRGGGGA